MFDVALASRGVFHEAMLIIVSFIFYFFGVSLVSAETVSFDEYHCFFGYNDLLVHDSKRTCDGDGSTYSVTRYAANSSSKSVAIITEVQRIKGKYYSYETINEFWSDCSIVDAKNFVCRKKEGSQDSDKFYQLSNGVMVSPWIRFKVISSIEYRLETSKRKFLYSFCSDTGREGPKCPNTK